MRKAAEGKSREGDEIRDLLKQGMDAAINALHQRERVPGLWNKNDFAARESWNTIKSLHKADLERMRALAARQSTIASWIPNAEMLRLDATAVAPFATGLGNEHPLENGFAFLNPYGLPYLPGSGVKGVLRQAARELASGEWGEPHGWSETKTYPLMQGEREGRGPVLDKKKQPALSLLDVLFGRESADGDSEHVRGALSFWDVIPQIKGDNLMVEIMTPHQSHYYQQRSDHRSGGSASPHDSGQPNPICFLTVPPGSGFTFHVICDIAHLRHLAPELADTDVSGKPRWQALLKAAFEHTFEWLGFGAKTAVGYGAMRLPPEHGTTQPLRPGAAQAENVQIWDGATLKFNPATGEVTATRGGKSSAPLGKQKALDFLSALGAERAEKLKKKKELKSVSVKVRIMGNMIELIGLADVQG